MAKDFTNPWGQDGRHWPPKWLGDRDDSENLNNNLFRKVKITITNIEDGWGVIRSYPNNDGKIYKVPLYICTVSGENEEGERLEYIFKCIRFGVQYDSVKNIGPQVVGLKDQQTYLLKWVYANNLKTYVWQVKASWLIHKGANNPQTSVAGALGCVEIVGANEWNRFNQIIIDLSGAKNEKDVADKKLATVEFEEVFQRPPLIEK